MESIIKKAIDGGYESPFVTKKQMSSYRHQSVAAMAILDPFFWQALGKACGWGSFYDTEGMPREYAPNVPTGWYPNTDSFSSGYDEKMWQAHALRFHELNLTEGWDKAVEWLQELVK